MVPSPDSRVPAPPSAPGLEASVFLRPIATPLPLGCLAQAVASVAFASVQLGWVPTTGTHTIALAVLVLTVPLQLVAGTMGFLARDPAASTGLLLFAGGWGMLCVATITSPTGTTSPALGVVLIAVGCTLLVPALAALTKVGVCLVVLTAAARFAATGWYEATGSSHWETVAGWIGVGLAALGAYVALALELEGAFGPTLLPVGRIGLARRAQRPDTEGTLQGLDTEPGVKRVL